MKLANDRTTVELTRRELDVVRLAVEGLSTREIANRLSRSPKTIDNHIQSSYRKLGVTNRVEMTNAVNALGLIPGADDGPDDVTLRRELESKSEAFDALRMLDERLSGASSDSYLGELALALASVFGVRFAGVSEAEPNDNELCIIVLADGEGLSDQVTIPMERCPCLQTLENGSTIFYDGLLDEYGDFAMFRQLGIVSYVGVRLDDRVMGAVGTLWIMDTKPISRENMPEVILKLFARRTASELAVMRAVDELHRVRERRAEELGGVRE